MKNIFVLTGITAATVLLSANLWAANTTATRPNPGSVMNARSGNSDTDSSRPNPGTVMNSRSSSASSNSISNNTSPNPLSSDMHVQRSTGRDLPSNQSLFSRGRIRNIDPQRHVVTLSDVTTGKVSAFSFSNDDMFNGFKEGDKIDLFTQQ